MSRRIAPLMIAVMALTACSNDDGSIPSGSADPAGETSTTSGDDRRTTTTVVHDEGPRRTDPGDEEPTTAPRAVIVSASATGGTHAPMAAAVSVVLSEPAQLDVTARSGDHLITVPRTATASTEFTIPVVGMRADRTYEIVVRAVADGVTDETTVAFDVPPLPDWLPDHRVTVSDPDRVSPGITLVETRPDDDSEQADRYVIVGYDETGAIVWYWATDGGVGGVEQTASGTLLSHYWPFGIREVDVLGDVVGNWQPEVVYAEGVNAPDLIPDGNDGDAAPVSVSADWVELRTFHHENWPLPDGNVLALSTTLHELTDEQRARFCPGDPYEFGVISDVVVEFAHDGTVLRTWDLWDAIDVDQHPGSNMCEEPGLFTSELWRDWTHANAVTYDPNRDAIIVSSRHTDQIVAFEHGDGEGPQRNVRWILGAGATMPLDGEPTFHQHAVEVLDDGAIIVYDNGNDRPGTSPDDPTAPPYSRAVIYDIDDTADDPANWSAHQRWQHIASDGDGVPIYTSFIGDADVLDNGDVLITHGGIGAFPPTADSPMRALVIEVVPDPRGGGEVVWQLDTDPSQSHTVYRTERIASFYVGDAWVPTG